jgi:hypothetical protein
MLAELKQFFRRLPDNGSAFMTAAVSSMQLVWDDCPMPRQVWCALFNQGIRSHFTEMLALT